ncbi:MAG: AAA family ATPase, partial [Thermodesulfobacteriota bacterium]
MILVGRQRELDMLRERIDRTAAGRGQAVFLVGEPGIGKTRTAEEVASVATRRGFRVSWGRCHEGHVPRAYWPWLQVLRPLEGGSSDVARVVERLSGVRHARGEHEPEAAGRARLFDDVARCLIAASREAPRLVVLDDLHWADAASLRLLRFVAIEVAAAPLLLLGTYRDRSPSVMRALAAVARCGECLPLGGLDERETAYLIGQATACEPDAAVAARIARLTEGNPFFVVSIARVLAASGRLVAGAASSIPLPAEVVEVVRQQLDPLRPQTRALLGVAAVIGRDFEQEVLTRVCAATESEVRGALEEGLRAHLVEPPSSERDRHWRFAHALIRETLYDDLPVTARSQIHRRVAEALAARSGEHDARAAEIAHHFTAAGAASEQDALDWSQRAAEAALGVFAYEESARLLEHSLELLAATPQADAVLRCDLLLCLGEALQRAGSTRRAKEAQQRAAEAARELRDPTRLARAALGFAWRDYVGDAGDRATIALLEEAVTALGEGDPALRARLLARLAMEIYFLEPRARRDALSADAVAIARRLDDATVLASALLARHFALRGPDAVDAQLALADEIIALGRAGAAREVVLEGRLWRIGNLFELGRIEDAFVEIRRLVREAERLRQPFGMWQATALRVTCATLAGRLDEAERLSEECLALGRRAETPHAGVLYLTQLFPLRQEQGRLGELEATLRTVADQTPEMPVFRAGLARMLCELGRHDEARHEVQSMRASGLERIPRDTHWLDAMSELALAASALGDVALAAELHPLLAPYAGRIVVVGTTSAIEGSVARHLGLLEATLARFADAQAHLEQAIAVHARLGAGPLLAYGQHDL